MTLLALRFLTVLLPAVLLDLILGDPRWLPHPVRWMGRTISALEPSSWPNRRAKWYQWSWTAPCSPFWRRP